MNPSDDDQEPPWYRIHPSWGFLSTAGVFFVFYHLLAGIIQGGIEIFAPHQIIFQSSRGLAVIDYDPIYFLDLNRVTVWLYPPLAGYVAWWSASRSFGVAGRWACFSAALLMQWPVLSAIRCFCGDLGELTGREQTETFWMMVWMMVYFVFVSLAAFFGGDLGDRTRRLRERARRDAEESAKSS